MTHHDPTAPAVIITTPVAGDQITYCTEWLETFPRQPGKTSEGRAGSVVRLAGGVLAAILAGAQHYTHAPRGIAYTGPILKQGDVLSRGGNAQGEAR